MLVGFRGKAFASLQSFKIFQLPLSTTYFQQNKFQFQHVGSRNYAIFSPKPKEDDVFKEYVDDPISDEVLLTTRNQIEGRMIIKEVGIVVGSAARSKSVLHDLLARIKGIVGGRLPAYEVMLAKTAAIATRNAMEEAKKLGGNQLVRVRYEIHSTENKLTGISCFCLCYATAVVSMSVEEYTKQRLAGTIRKSTSSKLPPNSPDAEVDDDE